MYFLWIIMNDVYKPRICARTQRIENIILRLIKSAITLFEGNQCIWIHGMSDKLNEEIH